MKPFLLDPIAPVPQPTPNTTRGRVLAVLSGDWQSSREIEAVSGVDRLEVDTVIQNLLRRGTVEREHRYLRGRTAATTQRYRRAAR